MPELIAETVRTFPAIEPVNDDVAGAMAAVTLASAGGEAFSAVWMIAAPYVKLVAAERLSAPAERATPSIETVRTPEIAWSCASVSAERFPPRM